MHFKGPGFAAFSAQTLGNILFEERKMKKYTIIVFLLVFGISCRSQIISASEKKNLEIIDSLLSSSELPIMNHFDITEYLEIKARDWKPLNPNRKVDSLFYKNFIQDDKTLGYWKDYQELYYLGKVEYHGKKYLAISQWVGNGEECYIYLIDFGIKGRINKLLLVSKRYKGPGDFDYIKSFIDSGKINRTSVRMSSVDDKDYVETLDSIIEKFNVENFRRIYYDSIGKK